MTAFGRRRWGVGWRSEIQSAKGESAGAAGQPGPGVDQGLGPSGAGAYEAAADQEKVEAEAKGDVDEQHAHEADGDVDDVGGCQLADHFGDHEEHDSD